MAQRDGPHCQAPTSFGEEGSELRVFTSVCLLLYYELADWLAGTGRQGGRPVTGLSVLCHRPLWHWAIDEEQQQEDYGLLGNRNRKTMEMRGGK